MNFAFWYRNISIYIYLPSLALIHRYPQKCSLVLDPITVDLLRVGLKSVCNVSELWLNGAKLTTNRKPTGSLVSKSVMTFDVERAVYGLFRGHEVTEKTTNWWG